MNDEPSFTVGPNQSVPHIRDHRRSTVGLPASAPARRMKCRRWPSGHRQRHYGNADLCAAAGGFAQGTLTYTATNGTSGVATVDIFLTDSGSNVAPNDNVSPTQQFTITVSVDVSVNDASVAEPPTGTANMLFTVALRLSAPPGRSFGQLATANGGGNPATGGAACGGKIDYVNSRHRLTSPRVSRLRPSRFPSARAG